MTTALELPVIPAPATDEGVLPAPRRWWVRQGRPAWSLPARAAITLLASVLYTWDLSRVGMGNAFYAAAVKSGTESWKAFLFGSLDPGSFITVDKPPAALWLMELSGRVFGFSSWSMLLPEALAGVASVLVVYRLVRRWIGEVAAVLASTAFALTPVAVLMFRYNNPDALLTLLLLLAGWALWSALERGDTWRLALCGGLLGLAFTTKMLQAFLVLPAFGLVYLWAGPPRLGRRVVQLLWAALALVVSSGWWVAVVELWPASSRPYVGGSTDNSELNLIFGYNGFSRVLGSGGSGGGGPGFAGSAGPLRVFNDLLGGQVSWLVPLALVGLVGGLWWTRRAPRTDATRAGFVMWGGWALVTLAVFSEMQGIFHPYYTVALAPAVAALAGGGAVALWRLGRRSPWWSWVLPAAVAGTAVWGAVLLGRTRGYHTGLGAAVVVAGVVAAAGLLIVLLRASAPRWPAIVAGVLAAIALLAGPAAYAATTIGSSPSGGDPLAGPATSGGGGFAFPGGRAFGAGLGAVAGRGSTAAPGGGATAGPAGAVSSRLVTYLKSHRDGAEYLVAVDGAQSAEGLILATGDPVAAMGGFTGTDPYPTVAEFKKLVATGKLHYVLVGGSGGFGGFGGGTFRRGTGFPGGALPRGGFSGAGGSPAGGAFPGGGGPRGAGAGGAFGGGPSGAFTDGGFPGGAFPGRGSGAGGPGASGGTVAAVMSWVESHATKVPTSEYGGDSAGTLYFVSSASASK